MPTDRLAYRLKAYDLSVEQFDHMWKVQGGRCGICKVPLVVARRVDGQELACIDHCHKTGSVRGLLCRGCNWGLGNFKDDPAIVTAALDYLARPPIKTKADHLDLDAEAESLWIASASRKLTAAERRKALVFMWHNRNMNQKWGQPKSKHSVTGSAKRFGVSETVIRSDLKALGLSSMASWPQIEELPGARAAGAPKASLPYAWRDENYDENAA